MKLAKMLFKDLNRNYIEAFCEVADFTRKVVYSTNNISEKVIDTQGNSIDVHLSTIVSTRSIHEQCKLALDGFTYSEVMEALVFNLFDKEGGVNSERSVMKIKIQDRSHLDYEYPRFGETLHDDGVGDETGAHKKNLFDLNTDSL